MDLVEIPKETIKTFLSTELRIILEVRKKERTEGSWSGSYLEELVTILDGVASRGSIHGALQKLSNMGILVGSWQKKNKDGRNIWVFEYRLAGEIIREWVDEFYKLFSM